MSRWYDATHGGKAPQHDLPSPRTRGKGESGFAVFNRPWTTHPGVFWVLTGLLEERRYIQQMKERSLLRGVVGHQVSGRERGQHMATEGAQRSLRMHVGTQWVDETNLVR